MTTKLIDKRIYAVDYPKTNIVINSANDYINQKITFNDFSQLLENLLKQNKDDVINIAINLAPSATISRVIWDTLNQIITKNNIIMLIPIISVIGAKQDSIFNLKLGSNNIDEILNTQSIITNNAIVNSIDYLLSNVYHMKLSQLYNFNNYITKLPQDLELVINKGQTILLHYIAIKANRSYSDDLINLNEYNKIKNKIAQILNQNQNQDLITYSIPFEPLTILDAINMGNIYYQDIKLHVEISDIIKSIRQTNFEPQIILTMDNNIIKIIITNNKQTNTLQWELSPSDDFEFIVSRIEDLLMDLQINYAIQ
jgi:hypothetical protein